MATQFRGACRLLALCSVLLAVAGPLDAAEFAGADVMHLAQAPGSVTGCGHAAWEYEQRMRNQCINEASFDKKRFLEGLKQPCRAKQEACRTSVTCRQREKAACDREAAAAQQRHREAVINCNSAFAGFQRRCGGKPQIDPRYLPRDPNTSRPGTPPGRGPI